MDIWKKAVLSSLESCGGEARYEEVCKGVDPFITLTEDDTKESSPGLAAFWIRVKLILRQLIESGDVQEIEPRFFVLTKQGRRRLAADDF